MKVLDGVKGDETGEVGNWTNVYDQSIIVNLPERDNAKYTANMRYVLKEGQSDQGLGTGSYEAFDSVCSETMVGVKQTDSFYT